MTNASKIVIKDKIFDLKEKISKQKADLNKQIEQQKKRYEGVFYAIDEHSYNPALVLTGLLTIMMNLDAIRKGNTLNQSSETLKIHELLQKKDKMIELIYTEVKEKLDIIEKAENHELRGFLKKNNVYSLFKEGQFEEFLSSRDNTSLKSKEKNKENIMEKSHGR